MLVLKKRLLSTTFLPLMIGMGVVLAAGSSSQLSAQSASPCAAANPCGPSAAQGMAGASDCVVPRLQAAAAQNPCAAAKPVNPCNPCAATNPCNPCAAANPCNPCNPCAAGEAVELTPAEASAAYACIKGVMKAAYAGEAQPAAGGPCNPCAATNPCNPCAAAQPLNPCNPCAATNPCNPCAATQPINPCNPCAATNPCKPDASNNPCTPATVQAAALTDEAASIAQDYQSWEQVNTAPYVSATHGSRYVNNYAGPEAAVAYREFEEIGAMPAGGRLVKDSFTVSPDGRAAATS
jgi:hypothetical protein